MTLEDVALLSHYDIYKGCCFTGSSWLQRFSQYEQLAKGYLKLPPGNMWKIPINFILLHCKRLRSPLTRCIRLIPTDIYIISLGLLGLAVFYPYGNVSAIDSYFFGVSSSTESGLNPYVNTGLHTLSVRRER
jgi:hypothetical protein